MTPREPLPYRKKLPLLSSPGAISFQAAKQLGVQTGGVLGILIETKGSELGTGDALVAFKKFEDQREAMALSLTLT